MKISCLVQNVSLRRRTYGTIRLSRCAAGKKHVLQTTSREGNLIFSLNILWMYLPFLETVPDRIIRK